MKKLLLALTILLGFQTLSIADVLGPSLWKNQRGSTLEITFVGNPTSGIPPIRTFQGTFINQAEGYECKGIPYEAHGIISDIDIIFGVTFSQCRSFATWNGRLRGQKLYTNWRLIYIQPNGLDKTLFGKDVFTRVR